MGKIAGLPRIRTKHVIWGSRPVRSVSNGTRLDQNKILGGKSGRVR
jgi:hypothetical protein